MVMLSKLFLPLVVSVAGIRLQTNADPKTNEEYAARRGAKPGNVAAGGGDDAPTDGEPEVPEGENSGELFEDPTEGGAVDVDEGGCPKVECPKVECPKTECPKAPPCPKVECPTCPAQKPCPSCPKVECPTCKSCPKCEKCAKASKPSGKPRWQKLMSQTAPFYAPVKQWVKGFGNPNSPNFSKLNTLKDADKVGGKFRFKIVWPLRKNKRVQEWKQSSNPMKKEKVAGYQPIRVPFKKRKWGGLEFNGGPSTLDGSANHGWWFYAIGSKGPWSGGIPGGWHAEKKTELWILRGGAGGKAAPKPIAKPGSWVRIFRQTVHTYKPIKVWRAGFGKDGDANFSWLGSLTDMAYKGPDGKFTFKIKWPRKGGKNEQIWKQSSNPNVPGSRVAGYQALSVPFKSRHWGGLEYNGGPSVMDGSANHPWWFYAIGSKGKWSHGIPGPKQAESQTELWVQRPAGRPIYLGCFKDAGNRDLPVQKMSNNANINNCMAKCKGHKFFGLQWHGQCFCGNGYGKHGKREERECNKPCKSEKTTKCGGFWRQNVYQMP